MMRGYYGGNGGYGNMMGDGGGILALFFGLIVLVGIVVLVMWAIRAAHGGHGPMIMHDGHVPPAGGPVVPGATGHHEAIAIAKRRLASGEITTEQYQEIIKTLGD